MSVPEGVPVLDRDRVRSYLARLGFDPAVPPSPTKGFLRDLQVAHLRRVPFENLDIHLGVPIVLDVERLADKIAVANRGGFCYELNGAFGSLLAALGFAVSYLEARVLGEAGPGIRFDHLCLRVEADGPRLVDVGFGAAFREPLLLLTAVDQDDPEGRYRIDPAPGDAGWLDLRQRGEPQYRFSLTPRALADFEPGSQHHQSSPDSHFTRNTVCTIVTPGGRATMRGTRLIETTGDQRAERDVPDAEERRAIYADLFGIDLAGRSLPDH